MEVTYFCSKGKFDPNISTTEDHKEKFTGAFLNANTTVFSEDDEGPSGDNDQWIDVRGRNNMSVFMDNENMSIYLRLDDCESGKNKFVSVTLDEEEIKESVKFVETVSRLKNK